MLARHTVSALRQTVFVLAAQLVLEGGRYMRCTAGCFCDRPRGRFLTCDVYSCLYLMKSSCVLSDVLILSDEMKQCVLVCVCVCVFPGYGLVKSDYNLCFIALELHFCSLTEKKTNNFH